MTPKTVFMLVISFYCFGLIAMQHQRKNRNYVPHNIHEATHRGDYRRVSELLKSNPQLVYACDSNYFFNTPLHTAVFKMHEHLVPLLIQNGANLNAQNDLGQTPLHIAAQKGYADIVTYLIQSGADFTILDKREHTPFVTAAFSGQLDVIRCLVTKKQPNYRQALCAAIGSNQVHVVDFFLHEKTINSYFGDNPLLHMAAKSGATDVVALLLAKGKDINGRDNLMRTPLHVVPFQSDDYSKKYSDTAFLLFKAGSDIHAKDGFDVTPFTKAAFDGNSELLELCLEKIDDALNMMVPDSEEYDAMMTTVLYEYRQAIKSAIVNDQAEIVDRLLQVSNINIQHIGPSGDTFLHKAAQYGACNVIQLLLARGADVTGKNELGETALQVVPINTYHTSRFKHDEEKCKYAAQLLRQAEEEIVHHQTETDVEIKKLSKSQKRKRRRNHH